ncbi:MAG: hypothetical protein ABJN65_11940 [Parasphingorhabdus sp.]
MSPQSRQTFQKSLSLLAAAVGFLSAAQLLADWFESILPEYGANAWWIGIVAVIALVIVIYFVTFKILELIPFFDTSDEKLAEFVLDSLKDVIPRHRAKELSDFLKVQLEPIRNIRDQHRKTLWNFDIHSFERKFELDGLDIATTEVFEWTNTGKKETSFFPIFQFGGNIVDPGTLQHTAAQKIQRQKQPIQLKVRSRRDRFVVLNAVLKNETKAGESTQIEYSDHWPNTMYMGWDMVLVPHPTYFPKEIGELSISLTSDPAIHHSYLYSLNLKKNDVRNISSVLESNNGEISFSLNSPKKNSVFIMFFERT